MTTPQPPVLLTAAEAAEALGVSARRVRKIAADREIGQRLGSVWVFTATDIERMQERAPVGGRKGRARKADQGAAGGGHRCGR